MCPCVPLAAAGEGSSTVAADVLWSDPVLTPGLQANDARGVGLVFGPDQTQVRCRWFAAQPGHVGTSAVQTRWDCILGALLAQHNLQRPGHVLHLQSMSWNPCLIVCRPSWRPMGSSWCCARMRGQMHGTGGQTACHRSCKAVSGVAVAGLGAQSWAML